MRPKTGSSRRFRYRRPDDGADDPRAPTAMTAMTGNRCPAERHRSIRRTTVTAVDDDLIIERPEEEDETRNPDIQQLDLF